MSNKKGEVVVRSWYDNSYPDPTLETFIQYDPYNRRVITDGLCGGCSDPGKSFQDFLDSVYELKQKSQNPESILLLSYNKNTSNKFILSKEKEDDENLIAINLSHIVSFDNVKTLRLRTLFADDSRKFIIADYSLFEIIDDYIAKMKEDD